ncbi:MAG: lipid A biosynthesis acyltransferase [Flavobacteriales bacterium CG_4_9_14_3_um_filter_32_8]|nr:MAG: lipid A biosynthesis acyltransferase [Flavobacteriales bacterium CG_4_9_14_3_um_filter_32_8]
MQAIIFYISLPFIYFISILPFWLLYLIADFINFILFTLVGYRKEVILTNLKKSFPEKSELDIQQIQKKFHRFFCDLIVETIKTLTITKKEAAKRCRFKDLTLLNKLYGKKKKVIFVLGHYGNWELGGAAMSYLSQYQLYVVYRPLSNPYFDNLIIKMRTHLGTKLIPMKDTFKKMVSLRNSDEISATAFIADQAPTPENSYWTTFLNQETAVFWGTEIIASKLNYPIVYITISQQKRGYYEMTAELLYENPASTKKGEISEKHSKRLEQDIIKQPELWLWSHKRWKHKKPVS